LLLRCDNTNLSRDLDLIFLIQCLVNLTRGTTSRILPASFRIPLTYCPKSSKYPKFAWESSDTVCNPEYLRASAKTNDGRLRLFIRLSLNEGSLTSYTRTLVSVKPSIRLDRIHQNNDNYFTNISLFRKFYAEESIMLREELSARFVDQLEALEHDIQFRLFVKDGSEFDQADYWAQQFKNTQNSISSTASNHVDEDILKIGQLRSVRNITPVEPVPIPEDKSSPNETDLEDTNITVSNEDLSKPNSNDNSPPTDEPQPSASLNEATNDIGSLNASQTLPEESPPSVVDMSDFEDTMKMLDEIEKTVPDTINQLGSALLKAAIEDDEDRLRRDEERLNILDEVFEQQKKEKEDKQKKFTEVSQKCPPITIKSNVS
jgi:hypothetical protein